VRRDRVVRREVVIMRIDRRDVGGKANANATAAANERTGFWSKQNSGEM